MKIKNIIIKALCISNSLALLLFTGCTRRSDADDLKTSEIFVTDSKDVALLNEEPFISVEKVENLPEDFMLGVDISTLIAEEESGVVYYGENGLEQDIMKTLKENGVNAVRIRVWNDPYDFDGNSYGGGHNDLATAVKIGKRATDYGMGVLIDFHYSDFWADPSKQMPPKKWADMSISEKSDALYNFTVDSLNTLLDEGVNITSVQVGNETTTGISGVFNWNDMAELFRAGSKAVRDVSAGKNHEMLVVLHFTNPENPGSYRKYAANLSEHSVDYDVFASSYYPFWHGSLENLTSILTEISENYNKNVMVSEMSYVYTFEDGDGFANTVSSDTYLPYDVSVQGQADCIRDVTNAVVKTGAGIGIFYWEPAWIPVSANSDLSRSEIWEKYGSGWASSYAGSYDPNDAGKYFGGSSWDNQALFDFNGHPLASLSVFRYMKNGAHPTAEINSSNID